MVSTRSGSSPKKDDKAIAGTKRKEHATSPKSKHETKAAKKQTTIEETIGSDQKQDTHEDTEMKEAPGDAEAEKPSKDTQEEAEKEGDDDTGGIEESQGDDKTRSKGDGAIEESSQREAKMPSSILEKGVIYFFTRNRVGIEDSESVGDLQRTFFVLRPLPTGAKLSDGAIPDSNGNRLFALPKKVFPKSHHDRFMAFVEKSNTTIQELKESFFKGSEYETKTAGTRHQEPVTTVAEGVYAITRTEDRTTHLAYATTIPEELGEIQDDLGLRSQGSFIISVKNPERSGPANASLPKGPGFPKEYALQSLCLCFADEKCRIIEEFRGLAWSEVKPKYLDYENCQILLIGEKIESATEPTKKDQKHDKVAPREELEQLEHEDELRIKHLNGKHSIASTLATFSAVSNPM